MRDKRRKNQPSWPQERSDNTGRDLDDELEFHFEQSIKELEAQGLSRHAASQETRRRFGDLRSYRRKLERIDRNPVADAVGRGWVRVMGVWQDIRHGTRVLLQHPSFTLAAVLSLALGIGVNTAIFSIVNSLLARSFNVAAPEQLTGVFTTRIGGQTFGNTSYPDYLDYKEQNDVFSGLVAHTYAPMAITGAEGPSIVWGQLVSWDYLRVLGVQPSIGRGFLAEEDRTFGAAAVVILSNASWRHRFGSDPDIVGESVRINGHPFTVIGVAPERFTGLVSALEPELWAPLAAAEHALPYSPNVESRVDPWLQLVGRLKPGVTIDDAQSSLDVLATNLIVAYPEANAGKGIAVEPLERSRLGSPEATAGVKSLLAVLMGVVGFVLLVACLNVANLQLAKASGRRREIALRHSLGASRWRIVQQLLVESLVLALIAGAVGLAFAVVAVDALQLLQPQTEVPLDINIGIDARVLGFTLLVALSTGVLFGLVPALQVLRNGQAQTLRDQGITLSQSKAKATLQGAFVVAQVALSLVLLVAAGLFVRSLSRTLAIDPGFDLRYGVIATVNLGYTQYDETEGTELRQRLLDRVAALPGVESATLSAFVPLGLIHGHHDVAVEGYEPATDEFMLVKRNMVSPRYFETMGIRVLRGRVIDERDVQDAQPVAMINEAMARRFWPDQDPVGRTVQADLGISYTVIGIIADGKYSSLHDPPEPYLVLPLSQSEYVQRVSLVVKTAGDPAAMVGPLSAAVRRLAPSVPSPTVLTMPHYLESSTGDTRAPTILVSAFSLLATVLAMLGLYGVMSYTVSRRRRELGIRMALGASQGGIRKMVLVRALKTTSIGIGVGLVLAWTVTRALAGFLYGVSTLDPVVFTVVAAALLAIGLLASYRPARFAAKVDPVTVLRAE
jgi:predicted permease